MFEHFHESPEDRRLYHKRVRKSGTTAFIIFIISLSIGMLGFRFIVGVEWIDSFMNASMILGGMGLIVDVPDNAGKIFVGCYALFSGVSFLSSMAIFLSPIVHRIIHRFHIDMKNE